MTKLFVQPRTLTLTAAAHVPVDVIEVSGPVREGHFEVSSICHDEPPAKMDHQEAHTYLCGPHEWDADDADAILSALQIGDQMIPDEAWSREERLVRVAVSSLETTHTKVRFLKLDLCDEDDKVQTIVEAESMDALLDAEAAEYREDDRLSPCYGLRTAECVSRDNNSIQWSPGDGGQYTIAVYAPDTPEGREEIQSWLEE